jgi:hypothetical protein
VREAGAQRRVHRCEELLRPGGAGSGRGQGVAALIRAPGSRVPACPESRAGSSGRVCPGSGSAGAVAPNTLPADLQGSSSRRSPSSTGGRSPILPGLPSSIARRRAQAVRRRCTASAGCMPTAAVSSGTMPTQRRFRDGLAKGHVGAEKARVRWASTPAWCRTACYPVRQTVVCGKG